MNSLRQIIVQEIRERGPIPFSRYMELCLYHPQLGYYSRNVEQFGKAGDFYTSSDVHAVFGRLMARQFEEMWRLMGSPAQVEILELGPGRGLFAQDVLAWSEKKFPDFFSAFHCTLMESSPGLCQRLQGTLSRYLESGKTSLAIQGTIAVSRQEEPIAHTLAPDVPIIVFANEFFDAFPVGILSSEGALRIAEKDGRFYESWAEPSKPELHFLDHYGVHPEPGERIEVSLAAQQYLSAVAKAAHRGFLLIIDYGYTRQEQLAGRHRGTLMTYRQHSASGNPYEAPGEQDITAHVNFTALASAAERNEMNVQPLVTQSQFLLGIGESNQFADAFEECRVPQERAKVALQLKHLITPEGMGETFRVMVATKGITPQKASELSGLNFGSLRVGKRIAPSP